MTTPFSNLQDDAPGFRAPLHNIEAEKAFLGAVLVNNRTLEGADYLRADHFALAQHGLIFDACRKLVDQNKIADPVTVKNWFEQQAKLQEVGGRVYLGELASSAVTIYNAAEYGRFIHDLYRKRRILALADEIQQAVLNADVIETADSMVAMLEDGLDGLSNETEPSEARRIGDHMDSVLEGIKERYKAGGDLLGLSTSLTDLDAMLGGLVQSDLIILAGRPSMGKSALAQQIGLHAAKSVPVFMINLEMSVDQEGQRLLTRKTGIPITDIRRGKVDEAHFKPLLDAATEIKGLPLFVEDASSLTVHQIRSKARKMKRKHGLGLVVIDYLQLIQADDRYKGQKTQEITEITRRLKGLAKELDVPVVALSQLSRNVEQRDNKRPTLSDLRESGSIEQDADVVMALYRLDYYLKRTEPTRKADESEEKFIARQASWQALCEESAGRAEIIVLKQRQGDTGIVPVHWNETRMTFGNLAR